MRSQRGAIEILEQAVDLLRSARLPDWIPYLTGAIPFTLALLFFLSDMSRNPFAAEHLGIASLGLAVLYVWKNAWQGVFMLRLYESLSPGGERSRNLSRLVAVQATLQPVGLVLSLPFPWLVAFFRNVALFAALGAPAPVRAARRQATLWTRQNWGVLALVGLAGLLLFANLLLVIVFLPQAARSLLGIEGEFTRLGAGILNLATIASAIALAWLVIDPVLDAVYVLRCFAGESISTGEDLFAALRKAVGKAVAILLVSLCFTAIAPRPAAAEEPAIDPVRLDRSIDQVIHSREFTWRMPRPAGEEPRGKWVGWVRAAEDTVADLWAWVRDAIRKWLAPKPGAEPGTGSAPLARRTVQVLIGVAAALTIAAMVVWYRRRRVPTIAAQPVVAAASAPNLDDESVTADHMPESSWLKLADELLAQGDCRLALRALHLAELNYLSERGLVSIRRWKTGQEYRRELERRARECPAIERVFTRNLNLFERGWYGRHPVDRETVVALATGLTEMRTDAGSP